VRDLRKNEINFAVNWVCFTQLYW